MRLTKNTNFQIAKGLLNDVFAKTEPLDYNKWVRFIDDRPNFFTWNENTESGKKTLQNIDEISENFRERVLASLSKGGCFAEYDSKKGNYNISISINKINNWITIQFARTPRLEDLRIFVEMANHLDALLLVDGTKVVNEETLKDIV